MLRCVAAFAALAWLAGCSALAPQRAEPIAAWRIGADAGVAKCVDLFVRLDAAVDAAGVRDGATVRVSGYPHLRTDRFLAGEAQRSDRDLPALLGAMRSLDRDARRFEIANLPASALRHLTPSDGTSLVDAVDACGARLLALGGDDVPARARVPDDYDTWKRVAGIYAIARVPFAAGVRGYQRDTARTFATPLDALPVRRALVRHVPPPAPREPPDIRALAPFRSESASAVDAWFARHAPVFEIDTVTDADLPGTVVLTAEGGVDVEVARPVMTARLVHTRFAGQVLPQLVYSVWFPARPKRGAFDLLGGHLDGITWRVTLGPAGEPWLYDSIHNCGCYHQFFPTPAVRVKPPADGLDEDAFVPQTLPAVPPGARIVVRVAADTHYLQHVSVVEGEVDGSPIGLVPDDLLRSLPDPRGGRRSLFGPDGIVAGSERGERWFFWPMGVREPGAMRQWGRHATAFIGRRHFDDADLLDRYFDEVR